MGDYGPRHSSSRDEVHVLVTGFGLFLSHQANPSWLIAQSLPESLSPSKPDTPRIRIHVHPAPLRVAYADVRTQLPPLIFSDPAPDEPGSTAPKSSGHATAEPIITGPSNFLTAGAGSHPEISNPNPNPVASTDGSSGADRNGKLPSQQKPNFDFVLLIGMASGRSFYSLESLAHRDFYHLPDVDNLHLTTPTPFWSAISAPKTLTTELDSEDVFKRWNAALNGEAEEAASGEKGEEGSGGTEKVDVRPSDNAGSFLCDFAYYTVLVEYWRRRELGVGRKKCAFLHVPGQAAGEDVKRGKRVAEELVRAMVDSEVAIKGT